MGFRFRLRPPGWRAPVAQCVQALEPRLLLAIQPLDPSFGTGGVLRPLAPEKLAPSDVEFAADGKIVAAVGLINDQQFNLLRLNPDGTRDASFGNGGWALPLPDASRRPATYDIALGPDGSIVGAGYLDVPGGREFALVRYTSDGAPDASFGNSGAVLTPWQPAGGPAYGEFKAVDVGAGGEVIAAGSAPASRVVARYLPDGSLDPGFGGTGIVKVGPDGSWDVADVIEQPDGRILVGSTFQPSNGGMLRMVVTRLNSDGTPDPSFGDGGNRFLAPADGGAASNAALVDIALRRDGRIAIAGWERSETGESAFTVYSLNPDGTFDTTFDADGHAAVTFDPQLYIASNALTLSPRDDGVLFVGGGVYTRTEVFGAVVAFNPDGSVRKSFGADGVLVSPDFNGIEYLNAPAAGGVTAAGVGAGTLVVARYFDGPTLALRTNGRPTTELNVPGYGTVGSFILERGGDLSVPLNVGFTVGGTAGAGIDYEALGDHASFPAGVGSLTLDVRAIDDYVPEPDETVVLTLGAVPGYALSTNAAASVVIQDNEGPDRLEPNDSFDSAAVLRLDSAGRYAAEGLSLHTGSDADFFSVAIGGHGDLTARLTSDPTLGPLSLEVYDASRTLVARSAVGAGAESVTVDVPSPGVYYLKVAGDANPDYDLSVEARRFNTVVGRYAFYNNSYFDLRTPGINRADDAAIATDKRALLPGQAQSFDNVTSYAKGINGLSLDIAGLTSHLTGSDFTFEVSGGLAPGAAPGGWTPAPAPASITLRNSAPLPGGVQRVEVIWPDRAVLNRWLRVTVLPTRATLLPAPDVFYFGNLVGETGDPRSPLRVSAADVAATGRNLFSPVPVTSRYDFDRDGRTSAADMAIARANIRHALAPANVPPPAPAGRTPSAGRPVVLATALVLRDDGDALSLRA